MKTIYLVETIDFYDGYWGYAYRAEKAFTTKEDAEQYLSSSGEVGRVIKIELEGGDTQ